MEKNRPDPDELLDRMQADAVKARRGRLKIFFGYAAGVGKTYAMLEAAQRERAAGVDVVVGYVEPHGRKETEALLQGFELLPFLEMPYRKVVVREFDLDRALQRHPQLILVDELAHTNIEGLRHVKRWQDINELLDAGIDVWTTCNVQHIESLNDVIAKISGVVVRETVPDDFFSNADELSLVDLPAHELLERLRQGKVYVTHQARAALSHFFRRENLDALRELALRRTAEHVHVNVESSRTQQEQLTSWETRDCLLVCVGPSPTSAKVIRKAKRLANALHAELIAIHVVSSEHKQSSSQAQNQLLANFRLAEQLGAETVTLSGSDPVAVTLDYARRRNVTKIVIGKSVPPGKWRWSRPTISDRLMHDSGEIDVLLVHGVPEESVVIEPATSSSPVDVRSWFGLLGTLLLCTVLASFWHWLGFTEANLVMTYLLGVIFISARFGFWPSIVGSMLAVLCFDVFFTEPYYTVVVNDSQYIVTFSVMLIVGLLIVTLTNRIRLQVRLSRQNEHRMEALYRLSRKLAGITGRTFLAAESEKVLSLEFGIEAVLLFPNQGKLEPIVESQSKFSNNPSEMAVAQWAYEHGEPAGRGTNTLPTAAGLYLPLVSPHGAVGVVGFRHDAVNQLLAPESRSLLEAYTTLIALALERDRLTIESQDAKINAEKHVIRSALLASVSHDIRTPLAVIAGASSSLLLQMERNLDAGIQRELLQSIYEESDRLTRLVENLLRMTQLSTGTVQLNKDWHPIEDVVGSALRRLSQHLEDRPVALDLSNKLILGYFDETLFQQVLLNLFENAIRYTPPHSPISIRCRANESNVVLEIADRGPGLDPNELETIFDSFQRGAHSQSDSRGAGLGLAICRAIVNAHGGTITAENREGGGALFRIILPTEAKLTNHSRLE
ncbi:MAG TPA: sensor histidine kinase KdpD [Pirellulaceae bacterium]|nr:sensor histidine kinase KdpD [Pirellulaceae bacterium]